MNPSTTPLHRFLVPAILSLALAGHASAADGTWDGGTNGAGTAWLTITNWVGDAAFPGITNDLASTNVDIATFAEGSGTTVQINMGNSGGGLTLGAIDWARSGTNSGATIQNNTTSAPTGVLRLNGATLGGISNTLIRIDPNATKNLTLGGTNVLDLMLGVTNGVLNVATTSAKLTINRAIVETNAGSALIKAGPGTLTLGTNNAFSGGLTINGGQVETVTSGAAGTGTITLNGSDAEFQLGSGANVTNPLVAADTGDKKTLRYFTNLVASTATFSGPITINETTQNNFRIQTGTGAALTVSGPISGPGGFQKLNQGTLVLSGTNTYAGNTLVGSNSGTLNLATNGSLRFVIGGNGTNNALTGSSVTVIDGQFAFDLSAASTTVGHSWTIVAATLTNSYGTNFLVTGFNGGGGLWTNTTNGATYVFAQSNSVLTVQSAATNNYDAWVASWQGIYTNFTSTNGTDDPEADGFINNIEFAFDGNPMAGTPAFLTATKVGTNAVFNFVARKNPPGGATYTVQGTTNLTSGWTNASVTISNSANTNGINIPADYERKEFVVPANSTEFYRVRAVIGL